MRTFVLSLKRLYDKQFITVIYLDSLLLSEKITQEEYEYITATTA